MNYPSFSTCESENYHDCLAYVVLQNTFRCKYFNRCLEDVVKSMPILLKYFIDDSKTIKIFKEIAEKYCTSDPKHRQCENFKLLEQGINPPVDLLPDGRKIHLIDVLLKKEITIE